MNLSIIFYYQLQQFQLSSKAQGFVLHLKVAIHAIGDKANDLVLDLYHSVASSNGIRDRRFRVLFSSLEMKGIFHLTVAIFVSDLTSTWVGHKKKWLMQLEISFMIIEFLMNFQIEHAQHLVPATTTRFGQQRVIASVQVSYSFPFTYNIWSRFYLTVL